MKKYLLLSITLFICISCSKKSSVNYDEKIDYGDTEGAILLSSFESNGKASFNGWTNLNSSMSEVSSSKDAPSPGGLWSVKLNYGYYRAELRSESVPVTGDTTEYYILSIWAKGKGNASVRIHNFITGYAKRISINTSSWALFTDTLYRPTPGYSNLDVLLSNSYDNSTAIYFDNVKVTKRYR